MKVTGNLTRGHSNDAGSDLHSMIDIIVPPADNVIIPTGVKIELPTNTFGLVQSRSGLAFKFSVEASNAGVIDEGYRGEIKVKLYNHGNEPYHVLKNDRVAQLIVLPVIYPEIESIKTTERGEGGFGHTGK